VSGKRAILLGLVGAAVAVAGTQTDDDRDRVPRAPGAASEILQPPLGVVVRHRIPLGTPQNTRSAHLAVAPGQSARRMAW
jgi:hypothetical protein